MGVKVGLQELSGLREAREPTRRHGEACKAACAGRAMKAMSAIHGVTLSLGEEEPRTLATPKARSPSNGTISSNFNRAPPK